MWDVFGCVPTTIILIAQFASQQLGWRQSMNASNIRRTFLFVCATVILSIIADATYGTATGSNLPISHWYSVIKSPFTNTPIPTPSTDLQKALVYIASRDGIPVERLTVINQQQLKYPMLDKTYLAIKAYDLKGLGEYQVLMDFEDGSFVDDISEVEQAEREAGLAKYGKLEPILYDRLATMNDEDLISVGIWVIGELKHSRDELYAILAENHPEAKEALETTGNPFEVGDLELGEQLENEYVDLLVKDTDELVQPLVDWLQSQGYNPTVFHGMASVVVTLPKYLILEAATRNDVGVIDDAEGGVEEQ
jgi:hypothetical protein